MAAAPAVRTLVSSPLTASGFPLTLFLCKRFRSSSPFAGLLRLRPTPPGLSHAAVRFGAARLNSVRCMARRAGDSAYSPLNSGPGGGFSDRPPTEMAPLFPGCDYEHWLIVMDKPGGEGATKQQMIDCYIQTLAKVVGSEEEAKKRIYNVSCERYFGFGCKIDEETSNKLEGLPGVLFVLPDSYVDPENKDYGGKRNFKRNNRVRRTALKKENSLFYNPRLSSESYNLKNQVWDIHLLNQKDFRKVLTALSDHMTKKELSLMMRR